MLLRGGPDTVSLLRSHARRLHRLYVLDDDEVWGVSAFVALDDVGPASYSSLLRDRLRSYPTMYAPPVVRLRQAGSTLLATFRRPHFTLVLPGEDAAERLYDCLGALTVNSYAVE